ncbi:MAG: response regulator [Candidatus Omnitrophica bacterium]|nr:response regulator [Candidatus Omnitrophota bacterium]
MDKEIRIILVDDEPDFIEVMTLWFKSRGYSVASVFNGREALKVIKQDAPDVVFLDIILPDIDGPAVLKKIRDFNKTLPVILMSAYVRDTRIEKKINFYGTSGIFYKGEDFSKALALLKSALEANNKSPH